MPKRSDSLRRRRLRARADDAERVDRPADALGDIRRIIGAAPQPIGKVLPEAIAEATANRGGALAAALEPTVTRALRTVAARESEWLGEILSPTIGAAVRKAVAAALAALMQRFNEALEQSLSVESLKWRLEARRTGRPFAEVVLAHTLVYRVEQVFLIHTGTGLMLQHLVAEGAPSADPDQVASMLSAIDSFGREAFEPVPAGVHVHELALGDMTLCIDRGPSITVAVVVRGQVPRSIVALVADTRERILIEHRPLIDAFVSDVAPFRVTRPALEQCLLEQRLRPRQRAAAVLSVLGALLLAGLVTLVVRAHRDTIGQERHLDRYRRALAAEPGIVVTSASRAEGQLKLQGLRDPVARNPEDVVRELGPPSAALSFEPFYSLEPPILEERFRRQSGAPPGVSVRLDGGVLRISGEAPHGWLERATPVAAALPGVERVDTSVSDLTFAELGETIRALEAAEVGFDPGSAAFTSTSEPALARVALLLDRIGALSAELRLTSCVMLIGDADPTGPVAHNAVLGAARARVVAAALRGGSSKLAGRRLLSRGRNAFDVGPRTRSVHFVVQTGSPCEEGGTG